MKDGQWYIISGWMGNSLGLRGNDLICFAVIYGFSMDGESQFKGNLDYLTGCMFATQPTALLSLKKLQTKLTRRMISFYKTCLRRQV